MDRHTLFALGYDSKKLYRINLRNNTYSEVTSSAIAGSSELVYEVGVVNSQKAYVVEFTQNKIIEVNLETGTSSTFLTIPGNPGLTNIVVKDESTAYVAGYTDSKIYRVNLLDGSYSIVTPSYVGSPGATPYIEGIALKDSILAYAVGNIEPNLYEVNLNTGASTLISPSPISGSPNLINLAIGNGKAFTVNYNGSQVYQIDLITGTYSVLANIIGSNLAGMTILPPFININNLIDNNLTFANYLNNYAPQSVVNLIANLPNNIPAALESAAPTRNAFLTYASQLGYLSLSRLIHNHEGQKKFRHKVPNKRTISSNYLDSEELLASLNAKLSPKKPEPTPEKPFTIWAAPFGVYSHLKAQDQTPPFDIGIGGVSIALDYNGIENNLIGFATAYLYSHVKENHKAGNGYVNQGFLSLYSSTNFENTYLDLSLTGGLYSGKNYRNIIFPGVNELATSSPKGYQLAPSIELGYKHQTRSLEVSPFILLDWVANWENKYIENGSYNFNAAQNARFCSLLHDEIGLRFGKTMNWSKGIAVFQEKFAYSYQKAFKTGNLNTYLLNSPGQFNVKTLSKDQHLGIIELSLQLISKNPKLPYLNTWYEGQFGNGYILNQLTFELGKRF